jgi:hypothetical protein
MILAALIVNGLFSVAGLIPRGRPTHAQIFSAVEVDYKLFANIAGTAIFLGMFALTMRRGGIDRPDPHVHAH